MKILVLGLGNELLGDDGVGIAAARALRGVLAGEAGVDVTESPLAGLALLDLFLGYDRAVVLDGIRTGKAAPGTVMALGPGDLSAVVAPSPHYAGLPEMLAVARRLELGFPAEVVVLAVEAEDPFTIGAGLSDAVRGALPALTARVRRQVAAWQGRAPSAPGPAAKPGPGAAAEVRHA